MCCVDRWRGWPREFANLLWLSTRTTTVALFPFLNAVVFTGTSDPYPQNSCSPFFRLIVSLSSVLSQDTQNLKSRVKKQEDFKKELQDNQSLLNTLEKTGQEMIEANHYAADKVTARVAEVVGLWKELLAAMEQKGEEQGFWSKATS